MTTEHPELLAIFNTYSDFVFRICMRYVKDRYEAEDLSQDVFLKVNEKLHEFRAESRVSTWIYRVAINCCIDHLRKVKRREELTEEHLDPVVRLNIHADEDASLAAIDLSRIIKPLKPQVRKILFLSLAEGLSYQEVSEVLEISKAAVAKTVERFVKKMQEKKQLKQHFLPLLIFQWI